MTGSVLLRGAHLVTLGQPGEVLKSTDLLITGNEISAVGPLPADVKPEGVLDLEGHVIAPALWNAHTHAAMTFTRTIGEDLPLDRWFNEKIWVAESGLTSDDVFWGTQLAAVEMIRSGTIGFADHYFHLDRVADVVEQSGMKALLAPAVFGLDHEVWLDLESSAHWATENQGRAEGRIRTVLGPHSPYICPPDFLKKVVELGNRTGLGAHIHLAESAEQVRVSLDKHKRTPTAHLHELGLFSLPTLAAHCIAVDEPDLDIMEENGVTAVQCPRTHMKYGMGLTPVPAMMKRSINVALGTDGPGSNCRLDMLDSLQLAPLLQKNHHLDATLLPGDTPLRMATANGAGAMGFANSGALAPGKAADLMIFDFRAAHLTPCLDVIGNLIQSAGRGDLTHVMADGRWLMNNRQLQTLDEARILEECTRRASAMLARGKSRLRTYSG